MHLKRILSSTDIIESANSVAQKPAKRVKRWRNTGQMLRWITEACWIRRKLSSNGRHMGDPSSGEKGDRRGLKEEGELSPVKFHRERDNL